MKLPENQISRRDFLAATAAALIALGLNPSVASNAESEQQSAARSVGISDAAYAKARVRAKSLAGQMTTKEKIGQLDAGADGISRLNIPGYNYYASEALHGLMRGGQVTSFPVPLALAAAWNPQLTRRVYDAVSDECRAYNILSIYSPVTLNLHRDPRWGRSSEAPGEDPCLAATLAVQIVRGMQGDNPSFLKTTACSKHFICNNTENDRHSTSAEPDNRSFWEYYTRAYRATILYGDVFTFMGAYSAIHGVPCCLDKHLLTDILRDQWGFRGYVTSDCDAIADAYDPHHYTKSPAIAAALGIQAGCDLDCGDTYGRHMQEAIDQGLITDAELGEAVTRLLTVRVLLGTLDPPQNVPYSAITMKSVNWNGHADLALEAARQSLVLLKNDKDFLPLDAKKVEKIAVIGPLAQQCYLGGYSGTPKTQISPLKGIAERMGLAVHMTSISGGDYAELNGEIQPQGSPVGTTQLAFIRDGNWARFDDVDFTGKTSVSARVASGEAGGTIEVHLDSLTGPLACTLTVTNTQRWENLVTVKAPLNGITGAHKIFLVFRGGNGYLLNIESMTLEPAATQDSWKGGREVIYRPGCPIVNNPAPTEIQDAVDIAKDADVVVLVCGINDEVDQEGNDRTDIILTGRQPELIKAIYAANPNTVLVLSSNNTLAVTWEQDNLPAIVSAICAGQAQGKAIADVLFGDYNPGGKLPCTWYRSIDQVPPAHDYDIHKGRTYMYLQDTPLYPFGHGLSYTQFEMGGLKASAKSLGMGGVVKYTVQVKNTGKRRGAEVVQLYVTPPSSPVPRPIRQLAAFQRVELEPGEAKSLVFELPYTTQAFWYWDENTKTFVCQPGDASIQIGNSSAHLPVTASLTLEPQKAPLRAPDAIETVAATSYIA